MFNDGKLSFYSQKNVVYIYRCLMMENYHSIAIKMWFKYIDV